MTNAIFASLHRLAGRPFALRPRLFRSAKNRARHELHLRIAATAAGFRLRLGGGTLRSGCVPLDASLRSPLHFPRSPTTDRSLKSAYAGEALNSPISDWPISDFPITDCKIAEPFGSWPGQREENPLNCMASSVASRILRLARLNARASVPPLTRPPPPGSCAFRFSSPESVCSKEDLTGMT